jgi:hypothetical protein
LLLLISLFASLSYMKIMKSLKSVQTQFWNLTIFLKLDIHLLSSLLLDLDLEA